MRHFNSSLTLGLAFLVMVVCVQASDFRIDFMKPAQPVSSAEKQTDDSDEMRIDFLAPRAEPRAYSRTPAKADVIDTRFPVMVSTADDFACLPCKKFIASAPKELTEQFAFFQGDNAPTGDVAYPYFQWIDGAGKVRYTTGFSDAKTLAATINATRKQHPAPKNKATVSK